MSKRRFILNVHKGGTIIQVIQLQSQVYYSECMVDSIMLSLVLPLSVPIYLIYHKGLNVNSPSVIQNYMLPCIVLAFFFFLFNTASEDPNTKLHLKHLAYSSAAPGDC